MELLFIKNVPVLYNTDNTTENKCSDEDRTNEVERIRDLHEETENLKGNEAGEEHTPGLTGKVDVRRNEVPAETENVQENEMAYYNILGHENKGNNMRMLRKRKEMTAIHENEREADDGHDEKEGETDDSDHDKTYRPERKEIPGTSAAPDVNVLFPVDGASREDPRQNKNIGNKKKEAHELRSRGKAYETPHDQPKASFKTYTRDVGSMNLSFHHPKKDQCSLCSSYRQAEEERKTELKETYDKHIKKEAVHKKKTTAKEIAKQHPSKVAAAVFDLQQVIYLPISKESAIFYKYRLSNYNFKIYNIGNKHCLCFLWHEAISIRGSCEIATCLAIFLHILDREGIEEVHLFSDGAAGQNKNSIVIAILMYVLRHSTSLCAITLNIFEVSQGQSEEDSAQSAVSTDLSHYGDVFMPCQLPSIITLARRAAPYEVKEMQSNEFLDYKKLSEDIRIKTIKIFDSGQPVKWTEICEAFMTKEDVNCIYFKRSHTDATYERLSLKRQALDSMKNAVSKLSVTPTPLAYEKYKDLVTLCVGPNPIVRNPYYQQFYKGLPYLGQSPKTTSTVNK
ncbi:hypothetical protein PR048_025650 [Dryococelus australis]|uniref:Uncharacterized protein n=1 Tax=Dryococelus australis TaxID=614101 RepID=A0ABQ9GJ71_9NEOP|nr:hypothetical protein PR048_025650 [Dryococelus australis]